MSVSLPLGPSRTLPLPPVRDDGTLYRFMMCHGEMVTFSDEPSELLQEIIDDYPSTNDDDGLDPESLEMRYDQAILIATTMQTAFCTQAYNDGQLIADNEAEDVLTALLQDRTTPFTGVYNANGELSLLWQHAVPLVLIDVDYEPFADNVRPEGNVVWIDPSEELAYLYSLSDAGYIFLRDARPSEDEEIEIAVLNASWTRTATCSSPAHVVCIIVTGTLPHQEYEADMATTHHLRARRRTRQRGAIVSLAAVLLSATLWVVVPSIASASAPHRAGVANVNVGGFTHPWLGSYNVSTTSGSQAAYCIDSGANYPDGNYSPGYWPHGTPSAHAQAIMKYIMAYYGDTTDPNTAAAVNALAYYFTNDYWANLYTVQTMILNNAAVQNRVNDLYSEANSRQNWTRTPWTVKTTVSLDAGTTDHYTAISSVRDADNNAVAGKQITVGGLNVTSGNITGTTNANGQFTSHWVANDVPSGVIINTQTNAPGGLVVWANPGVQSVLGSWGTVLYSGLSGAAPERGELHVIKTTTNQAYQTAVGAVFDVRDSGGNSVGTLTVGSDGNTNVLTLPSGTYTLVETSAPPGVILHDPVTFTLDTASKAISLQDSVTREGRIHIDKQDIATGTNIAGAQVIVQRDNDNDGTFESTITMPDGTALWTVGADGLDISGLAEGNYKITEMVAPPGYDLPPADERSVVVYVPFSGTVNATFQDHRAIDMSTQAENSGAPISSADQSGSVTTGTDVSDAVIVNGLAPTENFTVQTSLYGPFTPGGPMSCTGTPAWQDEPHDASGSGKFVSGSYTVNDIGVYTFVSTITVPGRPSGDGATGESKTYQNQCGDPAETFLVTPTISTQAQAPMLTPGAEVNDIATVTGLGNGQQAQVETSLYGPFESEDAMAQACASDSMGTPVGSVTDTITGTGAAMDATSSSINLPTENYPGVYTFMETLTVTGFTPVTHDCGTPPETFVVPQPPTITTQAQAPNVTPGATVNDVATITNLQQGAVGTIQTDLYGPFESEDAMAQACESGSMGQPVGSVEDVVTGTGDEITTTSSGINLPTEDYAGVYTFMETLTVPGYPPITHECGTPPETFVVPPTPTITTQAQAPKLTPGATVADLATIEGLQPGATGTIKTDLYGPFESEDAMAQACKAGSMGKPVGSVSDTVTGTGETLSVKSPGIELPTEDQDYAGVYTFMETLTVPGYPPITHECGTPPETFTVPHLPATPGVASPGLTLPKTGMNALPFILFGGLALAGGLTLLVVAERRRRA